MASGDLTKNYDNIAIGTLALGDQYVLHAILLANDLLTYHPNNKFYVLTDKPEVFSGFKNVTALPHKFAGVRQCYHDKRFVIEKMLEQVDSCLFLDADSRLLHKIDFEEFLADGYFLTCLHSKNLREKMRLASEQSGKRVGRRIKILNNLAMNLSVDFSQITFVQEPLLMFQSRYGDASRFFAVWDYCAAFTAMRFFEYSEGSSMGIAAEAVGSKINTLGKNPHWLFKDQLEDYKHKNSAEIEMSRQLIITRRAIDANYKARSPFFLKIPQYIYRYCKNVGNYFASKSKLRDLFNGHRATG